MLPRHGETRRFRLQVGQFENSSDRKILMMQYRSGSSADVSFDSSPATTMPFEYRYLVPGLRCHYRTDLIFLGSYTWRSFHNLYRYSRGFAMLTLTTIHGWQRQLSTETVQNTACWVGARGCFTAVMTSAGRRTWPGSGAGSAIAAARTLGREGGSK